jgi:hypothetical protein
VTCRWSKPLLVWVLQAKLKSQLVTVAECQQAVLDAEKQEVVTETALLAAEAKVSQLESEGKRAESSWGPPDAVSTTRLCPAVLMVISCFILSPCVLVR